MTILLEDRFVSWLDRRFEPEGEVRRFGVALMLSEIKISRSQDRNTFQMHCNTKSH